MSGNEKWKNESINKWMNVDYWWCICSCSDHLDDHCNGFVLKTICLYVWIRCRLRWCSRLQIDRDRSRIRSSAQDLVTNEKNAIWSHDGPRRAPQTAINCLGRKLGHIGGHMGITGRKSGSPDGIFPMAKVTFLMLARCGLKCTWKNWRTDEKS